MPRPRPLTSLPTTQSGYSSYEPGSLTPRTPHSRSGRAEEGFTDIELDDLHASNDEYGTERERQTAPLLLSPGQTGYRSRGDDHGENAKAGGWSLLVIISRIPLILGSFCAIILFILIIFSLNWPDTLSYYIGGSSPHDEALSASTTASGDKPGSSFPPHIHQNIHVLSYENYTKFPLLASEYRHECSKLHQGFMAHGDYWEPHADMGVLDVIHPDEHALSDGHESSVCKSTLTYMLDGEVGLLADLALMAQAAALARERNRTFLVDDTYWNRGKWTDHFEDVRTREPGPEPGCNAPPPEELVACPRLARHWVINSRTAKFHLGHEFSNHYEDPYAHQLNRLKPIFEAAAGSFKTTIHPNAENIDLIRSVQEEFSQLVPSTNLEQPSKPYTAVHLRRGDRKPASYSFQQTYVPVENFVQAAQDTWARLDLQNDVAPSDKRSTRAIYVASDSIAAENQFMNLFPEDVTYSLAQSKTPQLRALASPSEYVQQDFNALDEDVRITATRGMIVDFALISGMWASETDLNLDATICTFSSNICGLAAVGLGWLEAFGAVDEMGYIDEGTKRWIDTDQKGQVVPVWRPFELFN